jgi:FdhE protein
MAGSDNGPGRSRVVGGRIGDPTRGGIGQPVPVILPDTGALFRRRAQRLETLAANHPMADWLRFMAHLAHAQQDALRELSPAAPVAVVEGEPPLDAQLKGLSADWQAALDRLLDGLHAAALPDQTRATMQALRARPAAAREQLADAYLHQTLDAAERGAAVFVAAALAACLAHRAAALPLAEVHLLPQRGRCPVCGSAPVAGVVTAAGQAPGVRYLHCGLCATAWNHVRAMCTICGESGGLALHGIEGGDGLVQAETCDSCHGYAKLLYQAKDMAVEPMADDLASLGLDMLVGEAGYQRSAPNPLVP